MAIVSSSKLGSSSSGLGSESRGDMTLISSSLMVPRGMMCRNTTDKNGAVANICEKSKNKLIITAFTGGYHDETF